MGKKGVRGSDAPCTPFLAAKQSGYKFRVDIYKEDHKFNCLKKSGNDQSDPLADFQ